MKSYFMPLLLITLSSVIAPQTNATTIATIEAPSTANLGDLVSADVDVQGISDLYAFQFDLNFNPSVLLAASETEGSLLPGGGATFFISGTVDNVGGTVAATADTLLTDIPGVSGSGPLAAFTFTAAGDGTSLLAISNAIFLDSSLNQIDVDLVPGSILVGGATAAPEPSSLFILAMVLAVAALAVHRRARPTKRFSLATRKRKLQQNLAICLTLLSLGSASIARADFLDVRMFNQANYNQTAAGESFQGYTFEIDAITQSAAGFNSATATYPGIASPVTLSQSPGDPTLFATNYGPYASLSALHNDLPFGNYTVSFTNGTITNSATIDYTADYFQAAIPELTSASFSALQSANPSQAVTLNFNTFTPDPAANSSVGTFLTIYAPDGSVAFSTMVAADVGSVTVPAGTLLGNTSYLLTLDQGGRLDTGANGMGVNTELGFSINDNVDFTTNAAPAPEPGVFGLSVAGLGTILGIVKRRRRERTRAANFV